MQRLIPPLLIALLASSAAARPPTRAETWTADIATLASDAMAGRQPGTPGYEAAARYVEKRFRALGLRPAGEAKGFRQIVRFEEQIIDHGASTAALIAADGSRTALAMGKDILISPGGAPRPARIEAPLVFLGYGLSLPALGHDDFKGLDLKGKIAVVISGGPAALPGPAKSANRSDRLALLAAAGAVGVITLTTPAQVEIPWDRRKLLASQAGMYFADAGMRETPDGMFVAQFDPAQSARLFAGSGQDFAVIAKAADASAPVPTFALPLRLSAGIAARHRAVESPNLVARLPGSDPKLRSEHVVISAHLDHIGVGEPINGDAIYNGAMDDASGVASVLDIAGRLVAGKRPARSLLFLIVTAEEKGLLGSQYYARRPTVPAASLVADLNFDMPLPLWPLKLVLVQGYQESTLGDVARRVATARGLALTPDPLPERNSFTRTDQFSFVKTGVPALAFKFGFVKDSPEFQIEHDWRANRYHAPSDDADQPGVLPGEAVKLDDYVTGIARAVANAKARPEWLDTSVFKPKG
ncbi:MAG: peptidase M28 [Alphaproteobacteria bacterium PA4]|nr:MAG: peptidase M28 [Alphaproteobacteria bacterium PA4]